MNVLKKFIELTTTIHSYKSEDQMLKHLPSNVKQDKAGNYFLKIGKSQSMFAAHLDTVTRAKAEQVTHHIEERDDHTIVSTDGQTILGADDRAGVLVLLYMIEKKIPGLYYFFVGEELGGIGSRGIVKSKPSFFTKYDRCVSFDRKEYGSVISKQSGGICCSREFTGALARELTLYSNSVFFGDEHGNFTDSASFTNIIPECTNISVGYFNAHTVNEYQNITYLKQLCEAVCKVHWEDLPTNRFRLAA